MTADIVGSDKSIKKRKAETEIHGDTQRSQRDTKASGAWSIETVAEVLQPDIAQKGSPPKLHHSYYVQTTTSPKDVLKIAIWHLLPSNYPDLSATELHDRLRRQEHELIKHQCSLKGFQSAIYTALNEMMSVYVDKRRLEGARNRHEYVALQRRQGPRTQVKKRVDVPRSPDPAENIVLDSESSTILDARDPKCSPTRNAAVAQTPVGHAAALQSPPRVVNAQTRLSTGLYQLHRSPDADMTQLSAEQAHPIDLTEGTRDDVLQIQSGDSAVVERDKQDRLSVVSTALPKNSHDPLEIKSGMQDHTASDDCLAETPSTALVLRKPTELLPNNETPQDPKTPTNPHMARNQEQQAGAGFDTMQQISDQDPLVDKSSRSTQPLSWHGNKTIENREAQSHMQGKLSTRAIASLHYDGGPMQQAKNGNDDKPVDQVSNAESVYHEQIEHVNNVKNAALIAEQAHILKTRCEKYKRKTMDLQAQSPPKQTALTESINRANEDIKRFNELNLRHQKLQAQVSDSEAELAKARRQNILSQDEARRQETECHIHAASLARFAGDHTSASREFENEVRSLGLG